MKYRRMGQQCIGANSVASMALPGALHHSIALFGWMDDYPRIFIMEQGQSSSATTAASPASHCFSIIERVGFQGGADQAWAGDLLITSRGLILFPYAPLPPERLPGLAVLAATVLAGAPAGLATAALSSQDKMTSASSEEAERQWFWGGSVDDRLRCHRLAKQPIIIDGADITSLDIVSSSYVRIRFSTGGVVIRPSGSERAPGLFALIRNYIEGKPTQGDTHFANLKFPPIGLMIEKLGTSEHQELCQAGIFDRMAKHRDYVDAFVSKLSRSDCRVAAAVHEAIMTTVRGKFAEVYLEAQTFAIWAKRAVPSALIGLLIAGTIVVAVLFLLENFGQGPQTAEQVARSNSTAHANQLSFFLWGWVFLGGVFGFFSRPLPPRFGTAARVWCSVLAIATGLVWGIICSVLDPDKGASIMEVVGIGAGTGALLIMVPLSVLMSRQFTDIFPKDITKTILATVASKRRAS